MLRRWHLFWIAEGDATSLAIFRILFGLCLLREVATSLDRMVNAVADGALHFPYLDFLPPVSESVYQNLHLVQYPLIMLVVIGLFHRFSCASLVVIQAFLLFADRLNFRNHAYLFLLILILLLLSPAAEALSLTALFRFLRQRNRAGAPSGGTYPLAYQRLIQVQVCVAYFLAGLHKLHPAFLRGDVLRRLSDEGALPPIDLSPSGFAVLACAAAALELLLPLGLWIRRVRTPCIVIGIAFHLTVAFTMGIGVFSYALIFSYVLFLDPETIPALLRPGREARPTALP